MKKNCKNLKTVIRLALLSLLIGAFPLLGWAEEFVDGYKFDELEISQWNAIAAPSISDTGTARIYYDSLLNKLQVSQNGGAYSDLGSGGSGGAPTDAKYITQTANSTLTAEQALSSLGTGLVKNTTGTGVLSIATAGSDYIATETDPVYVAWYNSGMPTLATLLLDDNRTGTDNDDPSEASLIIDAEGDYGAYFLDGVTVFGDHVVFDTNVIEQFENNAEERFIEGSKLTFTDSAGSTEKFAFSAPANGSADSPLAINSAATGDNTQAIVFVDNAAVPTGDTSYNDLPSINLFFTNSGGADDYDYSGVRMGWGAQNDVTATNYFDFKGYTSAYDGTVNATHTELSPIFRLGSSGSATTGHSLDGGDVLLEGDLEVNGKTYLDDDLGILTAKNLTIGSTQWNSGDSIDGTKVANADLGDISVSSGVWSLDIGKACSIVFPIDAGGTAITTGAKGWVRVPFACTLTSYELTVDTSATITIDVWKDTYANFPPDNTDTITNGHEPAISAGIKEQDTDISDWTTVTVSAGDYIKINVDANDSATKAVLTLIGTKT